jgi:NADH dehydrogenase
MRVLLTGGTGFVGKSILDELIRNGHTVRLLVRDPARFKPRVPGVEPVRGNILAPEGLTESAQGTEAIIHLVGIISECGSNTFEQVHVEGTRSVVNAARNAGIRRFIHMSALGTRPQAVSRYHQSKYAAEESVRNSGLDYSVFRPSLIYGPDDQFVNLFAKISRWSPFLPVMGTGTSRMAPIAVESVAKAFVGALSEPSSIGKTYDLCASETLSFDGILRTILLVLGRRRLLLHIPLPVARAQAGFLEFLYGRLLEVPPPLNRDQLIMLQEDNVGDAAPASALFNLPEERFADGIRRFLAG